MGTSTSERRIRQRMRTRTLTPPRADTDLPADLAVAVATAALAEHPRAVVDRVEVDGEGLYTAHLVTCSGQRVVVPVDRDLTVLGWVALAR